MVRVQLLGELVVRADGREVELTGSWRARSVLAWLALHPGPHLRGDLAARFWPDVLDTSARASLRNALWALRRALGPDAGVLQATRDHVELQGASTDIEEFDRLAEEGRLADAVELWTGDPLVGLDDDWAYEMREELQRRLSGVLGRLAGAAEETGALGDALDWSRRRVALDPLAEDAQRDLIRRLACNGDRAGALEAYSRLRERLRRDLGLSPSGATRELVERIRDEPEAQAPAAERVVRGHADDDRAWEPGRPFPLPPRFRLERPARFVGRGAELARLGALLGSVKDGAGARLVLVTGEAGIGKSRLAWELGLEAHRSGAIVLHGSCDEEAVAPYEPVAEALSHWARAASARERATRIGAAGSGLAPLLPWLVEAPSPPAERSDSARLASFEAVASLLASLAAVVPVVLVIDDLQWADASSAALLRHVLGSRPEAALFVVATHRRGELAPDAPVAEALSRLERDGLLESMPLAGLERDEVAELARELSGSETSAGLTALVYAETEGNPFFVGEIARHLGDGIPAHRLELPDSVRELIGRRLAGLSDRCVRLLTVAAVIGREFELDPLERASDLDPSELDEALEEAIHAGLVVELPGLEDRLAFTHTLIRRTIADRLTRSRRRRIHARVAEALEAGPERADGQMWVAHHLCEAGPAGDPDRAVEYAGQAAEHAIKRLALAEAVELYTRALPLLPRDDPRRRKMALKRAVAFQALGHQYTGDAPLPGGRDPGSGAT